MLAGADGKREGESVCLLFERHRETEEQGRWRREGEDTRTGGRGEREQGKGTAGWSAAGR